MSFFSSIRGFRPKKGKGTGFSNPSSPTMPNSPTDSMMEEMSRQQSIAQKSYQQQPLSQEQQQSMMQQQQQPQQPQQQQSQQSQQVKEEPPLFLCQPFVRTTLVKGSFKTIVQLPKYVDYNEWLALNVFEMFTNLNQFFGLIKDFIPPEAPMAVAGVVYTYKDVQSNKQYSLPAGQFIEMTLNNINNKINDQLIFPTKNGNAFPPNFLNIIKNIVSNMFKIFAYIYYNQFDKIIHLSLEPHWNSFFAHFISFVKEFNLMDDQELMPMSALIISFEQQDHIVIS